MKTRGINFLASLIEMMIRKNELLYILVVAGEWQITVYDGYIVMCDRTAGAAAVSECGGAVVGVLCCGCSQTEKLKSRYYTQTDNASYSMLCLVWRMVDSMVDYHNGELSRSQTVLSY